MIFKHIMGRPFGLIVETSKKCKKQYGLSFTTIRLQQETPSIFVAHHAGETSWCKWQRDQVTGKKTLPWPVLKKIKPVFERLASGEILEKCLDGFTQNQNEALHGTIWKRAPKDCHHEPKSVLTAIEVSVAVFNEGESVHRRILEALSMVPGDHLQLAVTKKDNERVERANRAASGLEKGVGSVTSDAERGLKMQPLKKALNMKLGCS